MQKSDWVCIQCGKPLGNVLGGEYHPTVPSSKLVTSGPNLKVTCPDCGAVKVWYSSDPVVRAVYQLVDAVSNVAARAMIEQMGRSVHQKDNL